MTGVSLSASFAPKSAQIFIRFRSENFQLADFWKGRGKNAGNPDGLPSILTKQKRKSATENRGSDYIVSAKEMLPVYINDEDYVKFLNSFTEVGIQLKRTQKFLKENINDFEKIPVEQNKESTVNSELEKYMNLPYNVSIKKKTGEVCYYIASVTEFEDCIGSGRTVEEAYDDAMGMLRVIIMRSLENKLSIPVPAE